MVNKLDDTPAPGEKIEICLDVQYNTSYGQVLVQCSNLTSDREGFVKFTIAPQNQSVVAYNIRVSTKS